MWYKGKSPYRPCYDRVSWDAWLRFSVGSTLATLSLLFLVPKLNLVPKYCGIFCFGFCPFGCVPNERTLWNLVPILSLVPVQLGGLSDVVLGIGFLVVIFKFKRPSVWGFR